MAMAFNPFHRFRKHQRVILAVVTIALMLVFTISWGMGDITTRLFGGRNGPSDSGPQVTTLKFSSSWFSTQTKVYQGTVDSEARRRKLASDFVVYVLANATTDAMAEMAPFQQNPFQPPDPKNVKYPAVLGSYIQNREFRFRFGQ